MAYDKDFSFDAGMARLKIRGLTDGSKILKIRLERMKSFKPLWRRNTLDFQRISERWFLTGGDGAWPALAPSTVKARTRKLRKHRDGTTWFGGSGYYAKPSSESPSKLVMVWTGEGRDSLTATGVPGSISTIDRDRMTYGTDSPQLLFNAKRRPPLDRESIAETARRNAEEWVFALVRGIKFDENRGARFV